MFYPLYGRKRIEGPSERELQVIGLRAQGYSEKEIAHMLCRSASTIKCHSKSIINKLHAKNMTNAVYLAQKQGLLN